MFYVGFAIYGNTQLMSDLKKNQFYPSAERIRLCIPCIFASLSGPAIDLQNMPILAKKIIFSDEAQFDLGGYMNNQNCCIWGTENPHAYIDKPTHPKRVTVWCGFWSRGIIGYNFSLKMSKERPLQSMAIVIGPY